MTTSKLADKYVVKQNKIRNQCTLLRGQVEDGVVFFLDKVRRNNKGMRQPTTNMENTWYTPGGPEGKGNHVQNGR